MNDTHALILIGIMSVVTILLRFLPFMIFGKNRQTPKFISYLGEVLPYAIMGMLVVYCLKDTGFAAMNEWLPALVGVLSVVILQITTKRSMVSIIAGTVIYMVMVNII